MRRLVLIALASISAWSLAQPSFVIGPDQTRTGTIPASETRHVYTLDLSAGFRTLDVEVSGGGRDADLAVYFGSDQLHYDISSDPNPAYRLDDPRPGPYRIEVLNLLRYPLDYTLRVATDRGQAAPAGAATYYVAEGGLQVGPLSPTGLRDRIARGVTTAADLVWRPGLEAWTRADALAELADAFAPAVVGPPPLPGAPPPVEAPRTRPTQVDAPSTRPTQVDAPSALAAIAATCATTARGPELRGVAEGAAVAIACPAGCGTGAAVWGSDVYTDDSSVCAAAGHAGVVDLASGGSVSMTILAGETSYVGTTRHGVTTRGWGSWGRSFAFVATTPSPVATGVVPLGCATPATDLGLEIGGEATVGCPGGCPADAPVWGTDAYAGDSSVCRAAVHAGLVDAVRGGVVTLTLDMGRTGYSASERHGVASLGRALYAVGGTRSFTLAAAAAAASAVVGPSAGGAATIVVGSDQAATLTTTAGVVIAVPAGAVPLTATGEIGTVVFSAEPANVIPAPPAGFAAVGATYQLGPDALALEQSVAITFPIPDGVDPADVVGLTTFDPAEGAWVVVPGSIDPVARTVTVWTDHLSPWAVATRPGGRTATGGHVRVTNGMARGGGFVYPCRADDPACRPGLPTGHGYGVCMVSWDLVNPYERFWGERDGASRMATAADGQTTNWWLPDGTYVLEPFFHVTQINHSPLYVPRHQMYVRSAITVTMRGGQAVALGNDDPRGYVEGWPRCLGGTGAGSSRGPITAVGTGDVQVTLTWQADVDVDLYVTDPSGSTVYYGNRSVASGGELDRDNMCGDFEWGRPENVYWPAGRAPSGPYEVRVRYYGSCGHDDPQVNWTVRTVVAGQAHSFTGTLAPGAEQLVTTFTLP